MIAKLIWKEWVEQRWKLALCCVLLAGFTAVGLRARVVEDEMVLILAGVGGCLLLPIFVGMDLLAAERAEGSLAALLALPVQPWKVLAVKLLVGVGVIVGYMLAACATAFLVAGEREVTSGRLITIFLGCACFGIVLLIWMTAFGARQPSEARAAVAGMAVLTVWLIALFVYKPIAGGELMDTWPVFFHPACILALIAERSTTRIAGAISVQLALAVVLFLWGARRLARAERGER